jgi:hypothetical protein
MGRPRQFDEPATRRIAVRVTPAQQRDLQRVASENQTDVAGVIRQAVNEYVSDYRDARVFRLPKP